MGLRRVGVEVLRPLEKHLPPLLSRTSLAPGSQPPALEVLSLVSLGLSFHQLKSIWSRARLWRWFSSGGALGGSLFEALSTKITCREHTS